MPDVSLNGIEFTVKGSADEASASIDSLIESLNKLAGALGNAVGNANFGNIGKKAKKELEPLSEALQETIANASKIDVLQAKMQSLGRSLEGAFKSGNEDKAWSIQGRILSTESALEKAKIAALGAKSGIEPLSEEFQNLVRNASKVDILQAKLDSLKTALDDAFQSGNADKAWSIQSQILSTSDALKKATNAANGTKKEIKDIGHAAKRASSPLKSFVASIKRIAMYRIIRSIIKEITEAIKEGAKNFYDFSKAAGAPFAAAMDGVKASAQQMKNQLGAAFGTLFTTIAPILNNLISLVTKFANVLTMIFARLGGAGGWYRATEASADAISEVGGAAKEAMRYLAPFDELNRLPDDRGGGGGGSSGDGGGYEWVSFEQFDIGDGIASIFQHITDALNGASEWIENVDWQNLASNIVTKIGEAMGKVDWAGFTSSVARFLGAALGAVSGFLVGALADLVTSISDGIYNAFHNDDGTLKTGEEIWNGICEGIKNAVVGIYTWVKENVVKPFVDGFKKAFGIASPSTVMAEQAVFVGQGILSGIKSVFTNISAWVNTNIVQPLKNAIATLGANIKLKVNVIYDWYEKYIKPWWNSDRFTNYGKAMMNKLKAGLVLTVNTIGNWYNEKVKPWFTYEKWHNIGANAVTWMKNALSFSSFAPLKAWWDDKVQPWFTWEKWKNLGLNAINAIKSGLSSLTLPKFHLDWEWSQRGAWVLGQYLSVNIPWPKLSFYAKGGIVDGATMFGTNVVGEAGKEAIVPLERNTEWVGMVASGLVRELAKASGGNDNASLAGDLYAAFSRALSENADDRDIVLDGDVVYRKMVQRNRRETFRSGINPMMSMG